MCLNVFISRHFKFGPFPVIRLLKARPNFVYLILSGRFIGVDIIDEFLLGQPKGGRGRLIKVAAK